jgi:acetyltransferase-like isoleucine patch superfamily enzyme
MGIFIHTTADVSSEADIGENTKIWHLAQVREGAIVGANCIISKNVYVDTGVRIGNNVKIQNNVNIYNGVIIEDDVFLGPSMTFTNDLFPRATNTDWIITKTIVKKGASIGANATIVCGVTIGKYAMVGAGAVITKDIHDYTLVVGNPAKVIGKVCRCGVKLANASNVCDNCSFEI